MSKISDRIKRQQEDAQSSASQRTTKENAAAEEQKRKAADKCWKEIESMIDEVMKTLQEGDDNQSWPTGYYYDSFVEMKYNDPNPWRCLDDMFVAAKDGEEYLAYRLQTSYDRMPSGSNKANPPFVLLETGELAQLTFKEKYDKEKKKKVPTDELYAKVLTRKDFSNPTMAQNGEGTIWFDPGGGAKKVSHREMIKFLHNLQYSAKRWRIMGRRA